jgi:probable phosphoglycerate mutase
VNERRQDDRTRVLLVRHGETEWNREGRIQGWAPSTLTETGRQQSRRLGRHLTETYDIDRVVASDLRRTRETTALVGEAGVAVEPTFQRAWRERDFGRLQGLRKQALFEGHPEYAATSGTLAIDTRPPGGERLRDLRTRVMDGWEHLRAEADGETVLVVTHGGPIYIVLGSLTGQDILTAVLDGSQENCAVNEVVLGDSAAIVRHNETV